jgi:hypothetical protein
MLETDQVTVTRVGKGIAPTVDTIYVGNGSLQEGGGSTYFNPAGNVEVADALLIISNTNPQTWGDGKDYGDSYFSGSTVLLPPIEVGDFVVREADSKRFLVVSTSSRTSLLPHLEIKLKIGPQSMVQK